MKTIERIEDIVLSVKENTIRNCSSFMTDHLKPGDNIEITWRGDVRDCVDKGYCFSLPSMDADCGEMFIHVIKPDNPGGKDTPPEVFIHMADIIDNKLIKKIRVI